MTMQHKQNLLIENFVNIFFVASLSVSLHNLLDFYTYIYIYIYIISVILDYSSIPSIVN
jgi:hypothetical protein